MRSIALVVMFLAGCETGVDGSSIRDFLTTQGAGYCPNETGLVATVSCGIEIVPGVDCRECYTSNGGEAGCALNDHVWCEASCDACEALQVSLR